MISMQEYMKVLGLRVRDKVTGLEGIVTVISFDLFGCVQAIVHPGLDKDKNKKLRDSQWFDVSRLSILEEKPVMSVPGFSYEGDTHGPTEKPKVGMKN